MNVIHYDLFAGIGGFSYALDTIFTGHHIRHIFCEWEAFPTSILKKHWPDATYYGDIADLVADTNQLRERAGFGEVRKADGEVPGQHDDAEPGRADCAILTGGFPCQPFSVAGRRQGTADDRYKWPEMFAVIRNVKPDWVIAENVRGLVTWNDGMVLETVCTDLESEGYQVQPFIIPACAVGAPHRRDRVWIIAHSNHPGGGAPARHLPPGDRATDCQKRQHSQCRAGGHNRPPADKWSADWHTAASATCHDGVDDGLPRWMDGATVSAARHRRERLKTCGNAIVPQVAMEILHGISQEYPKMPR